MSNDQIFRLTTKDYTILEVMLDRRLGRDDPLVPILQRKLSAAIVTFREDIPANVVTLRGRNKNCSQRHAKVEPSVNVMRRGVTEPEV
ncbi:hypothetical protein AB4Z43_29735 [Mesorhizobium sp. 2RAF45]|uniref:hypothetical protein n=1 Tax=Mesorhizobium sp. 2RAF45 TaxID=3233001 RepID=UPI003F9E569D